MRHNLIFFKKELIEGWRTKKIVLLMIVFAAFGIMNPLIALLTPEIIKHISTELVIQLPEPTSVDVWTQYFKNIGQMGLIIFLILFGDCVSKEIDKQTLIIPLTKGLKRSTVILTKTLYVSILWTGSLLLTFLISYLYSLYYFPDSDSPYIFYGILLLWLYGLFLFSIMILGSTLFKGYMGLLIVGLTWVIGALLSLVSELNHYNPFQLSTNNIEIVTGAIKYYEFLPAILISMCLMVLFTCLSIKLLNKKIL